MMCAAVLADAAPASAAAAIRVDAQDCAGVDAREVERLLAIELETLAPAGSIEVRLACAGAQLRMTARDPVLNRALVREVELGPPDPGRDRTIALLVSQLFLTSWAEEFLEHPVPRAPAPWPAERAPAATPRPPRWEARAAAGTRLRDWAAPALGVEVAVTGLRRAGPVRLLVTGGFERGAADRVGGSAAWTLAELGGGLGRTWRPDARLQFATALTASAAWAQVQGQPASAAYAGGTVRGVVGQAAIAAGPQWVWTGARAGLDLELGATWPGATARISGDREVRLGGAWAGARLWVGWGSR